MKSTHRAIFDFTVDSDIPFQFLRAGLGSHTLQISETSNASMEQEGAPAFEWKFRDPERHITARLYHSKGIYHFWTEDVGWFRIDPAARRITMPQDTDAVRRELRLWGVPTMLCLVELGDIALHASAVEVQNGAVLFAAPGRYGKTTLAMAFHEKGYRVLSEDLSCCRIEPGPVLFPGPASLRVRPDIFDGHAPSGTDLVSVKPDRVFLSLKPERCGTSQPVAIQAIVFLRETQGEIRLEPVEPARALPDLWALTFRQVGGEAMVARSFRDLSQLAAITPVWNLHRPMRLDTLGAVVDRIVEACVPA